MIICYRLIMPLLRRPAASDIVFSESRSSTVTHKRWRESFEYVVVGHVLLTLYGEPHELVFTSASAYVDRNMRIDEEEFI